MTFNLVLLVMFAALLALPRHVAGIPANDSCTGCHAAVLDMSVAPVDFQTACKSCHLEFAGSHPFHQAGANCGAACHPSWGSTDFSRMPLVTDPVLRASFASLGSKNLPSEALHAIHSKPSWPAAVQGSPLADACRSCHATAACNACHTGALSLTHKNHSGIGNATYSALAPWTGITGRGVVGGDLTVKTAVLESSQCGTPGCHRIAEMQSKSPRITEDYNYAVGGNPADPTGANSVITTGTWRARYATSYTGGRMSFTTSVAEIQVSVSGGRVEIIGETDPYRGIAQVLLDGTVVGTFDEYAPTTTRQAVVYSLDLPAGTHTVTVRSTGALSTWARASFVVVDAFRVYPPAWSVPIPTCSSCHDYSTHPAPAASHTSAAAGMDTTSGTLTDFHSASTLYSFTCAECHAANIGVEHVRSSTSTTTMSAYPDTCAGCHRIKVDNLGGPWDSTCAGNGSVCHPTQHTGVPAGHDASSEIMPVPGSESRYDTSGSTLVNEGWESGTYTTNGWTYAAITTTAPHSGTYTAQINASAYTAATGRFSKEFNTTGLTSPTLTFWSKTTGLLPGDKLQVYYSTTGYIGANINVPWIPLYTPVAGNIEPEWTQHTVALPNAPSVIVIFTYAYTSAAAGGRNIAYDDITVTGTTLPAWTTTAVPAGSNAVRSCGTGYLNGAANCHDVSDLTDIHSKASLTTGGNTYTSCLVCHRDDAPVPTSVNCQSAACHPGVNGATHLTTYHQSGFGSDAAGPFTGTGFESEWCSGCHFSGIAEEHGRLSAYGSTSCAVCHKKTTDSAAPLNVTAANTSSAIHGDDTPNNAVCSDCHATQTATTPHARLGVGTPQFDLTYSGHRAYPTLRGAVSSGMIGTQTITNWAFPADSVWLKTVALGGNPAEQLTPISMVRCDDCHGFVSGAQGPHGATMSVNYATNPNTGQPYDGSYTSGGLFVTQVFPEWRVSMSNTTALCNKCHVREIDYNYAHNIGAHSASEAAPAAGRCINCHIPIPHGWKRPRLLGYTSDPAPYTTLGLAKIKVRPTEEPLNWQNTDCGGCGVHGVLPGTEWP